MSSTTSAASIGLSGKRKQYKNPNVNPNTVYTVEDPVNPPYDGGPLKIGNGRLSSLHLLITLLFVLVFSSVVFVYIYTSSLEQEGVRVFHEPIRNPIAEEDAKLRALNQKNNHLKPVDIIDIKNDHINDHVDANAVKADDNNIKQMDANVKQRVTDVRTNSDNFVPNELETIDDYKASFDLDTDELNKERRAKVRNAMIFAYQGYEKHALGHDELKPVSGGVKDWVAGGMAMTMIDSLDTLFIMGLKDEFNRATDYIDKSLGAFNTVRSYVSVFETNIRVLGGFLSAYDLSKNQVFLKKAIEIAELLSRAYDSKTGMFSKNINLGTGAALGHTSLALAEIGTLQLEFRRLSQLTGDPKYDNMVTHAMEELRKNGPQNGLFQTVYHPHMRKFYGSVTLGGLGDSFFEYLLKQWLLTGKTEKIYLEMYQRSLHGIMTNLVENFDELDPPVSFIAENNNGRKIRRVQHLACFAAGMLALGEANGVSKNPLPGYEVDPKEVMKVAEQFTTACVKSYQMTKTGIGPESFQYNEKGAIYGTGYYILRPETIESLFILYRITHDKKYQEWAWEIFNNIEKHCKTNFGYSGLQNVDKPGSYNDVQESFFLAETLKYLYLIFSPENVIPLDKWVLNTEAHPLRIVNK